MGRAKLLPTAVFILAAIATFIGECRAADPTGLWLSESGKSRYRVTQCGTGICVQIAWIVEGPKVTDEMNPDPAKRRRRVTGIDVASDFRADGADRWKGSLYNFKNGKTYQGRAEMHGVNQLKLAGCVLGGILCLSQTLSRLE
ncbi:DUF2147 domain-containing protein [Bradyrhizobium sp.]|jgi:uncharacterized protein (DUF2147 family)|uniref:DUF2147 domain-containing protein n=1 Tax=Bradyrhizobium sp. TaxID=376 RepID=UPI002DF87BEA|nr:DUF2147 domain-containing protein [Bradyrhizobium sp.]